MRKWDRLITLPSLHVSCTWGTPYAEMYSDASALRPKSIVVPGVIEKRSFVQLSTWIASVLIASSISETKPLPSSQRRTESAFKDFCEWLLHCFINLVSSYVRVECLAPLSTLVMSSNNIINNWRTQNSKQLLLKWWSCFTLHSIEPPAGLRCESLRRTPTYSY